MTAAREPYPPDVSDEEWEGTLVAPHLILPPWDAGQRTRKLPELFKGSDRGTAGPRRAPQF